MSDKILVVDDEPRVVRLVSEVLNAVGYQVVAAASGESAIEQVALEQPDLVLLDWDLPCHLPADLVAEAKSLASCPQVIVLGRDFDLKPTALAAGADAFVLKGDSPRHLLAAVQQAWSRCAPATDNETTKKKGE